jgi:hypothetical protein
MRKKGKNKLLEERLLRIERLYDEQKIDYRQMEVLDTAARIEAGMLNYNEIEEETLKSS